MHAYRVTKYDPRSRNDVGHFTGDEWTSVSDIGRLIGASMLTAVEYLRVENLYVQSVQSQMSAFGIDTFRVSGLEVRSVAWGKEIVDDVCEVCRGLQEDDLVSGKQLEDIIRGCLRSYIWCRLSDARAYIHFGYDYYMYIGLPGPIIDSKLPAGIFAEECASPYAESD